MPQKRWRSSRKVLKLTSFCMVFAKLFSKVLFKIIQKLPLLSLNQFGSTSFSLENMLMYASRSICQLNMSILLNWLKFVWNAVATLEHSSLLIYLETHRYRSNKIIYYQITRWIARRTHGLKNEKLNRFNQMGIPFKCIPSLFWFLFMTY